MNRKNEKKDINSKLADFRRAYREHAALKYVLTVGSFVLIISFLLFRAITATHTSQTADTKYNDYQDLSDNYTVGMTYKAYNPKKNFMVIALNVEGQDDTTINYPELKIQTKLLSPQEGVKTKVIRAGDSSYAVIIKNLKPGFGAVLLKIGTLGTQDLSEDDDINTSVGDTPEQIQSSDTTDTNTTDGTAKVYINEISKINNTNLVLKSDKDYWLDTVAREAKIIHKNKKQIANRIKSLRKKIANDRDSIKSAKKNMKYQTKAENENTADELKDTKSDIKINLKEIKTLEKVIRERNEKVKLLNKKADDIRTGKYKLSD
ncbi:hypothetical protein [Liquorilactobacillus hordei]|uniref:hypothetical protein n=1 Tax=Liquorilactobacillus hordei TaxID=468911 RepID=UPI001CBB6674|nr:hypothetical protein [Liquorilactobacillus hordei]MBZ2406668.1 hypothetical protein [Liquorilactobacillus hordei]